MYITSSNINVHCLKLVRHNLKFRTVELFVICNVKNIYVISWSPYQIPNVDIHYKKLLEKKKKKSI